MYFPPYDTILRALGTSRQQADQAEQVTIPVSLLKILITISVSHCDFNQKGYLEENPDIADALKVGKIESARLHYETYGYWEGRRGATPKVDERWYRQTYPDVAAAIEDGEIGSAKQHYLVSGVNEFRSPNDAVGQDCEAWKSALTPTVQKINS